MIKPQSKLSQNANARGILAAGIVKDTIRRALEDKLRAQLYCSRVTCTRHRSKTRMYARSTNSMWGRCGKRKGRKVGVVKKIKRFSF